ncbi:MAG TPA: hypothetical protein VGX71_26990 [Pseudaminobacter sp.]|nr:hypothetical protein [Pseudaminobacter sp.]
MKVSKWRIYDVQRGRCNVCYRATTKITSMADMGAELPFAVLKRGRRLELPIAAMPFSRVAAD